MKLYELKPTPGSSKKPTRKGRGPGSGNGKTGGKGHKGQNARAGGGTRPGFEGGQMPLYRRLPKRGFNNTRFATVYSEVNICDLNVFESGSEISIVELQEKGLVRQTHDGVAILGTGEITKKLIVKASKFSKSAKDKLEAA